MDTARLIKLPAGSLLLTILTLLALVAVACSTQTTSPKVADLNDRGLDAHNQGKYREALENFQQALATAREVGNRAGEGTALNNIGAVHKARGQYDQALQNYQQALVIAREVGYKALEEAVLTNIESIPDN